MRQTKTGVQDKGGHNSTSGISLFLENFGQGLIAVIQDKIPVIPKTMHRRIKAGHDGGMRRQGEGNRSECLPEHDSLPGQGIDGGSFGPLIPVASQVIGPQGVNGYQHQIVRPLAGEQSLAGLV